MLKVVNRVGDINPKVSVFDTEGIRKNAMASAAIAYKRKIEQFETDIEATVYIEYVVGQGMITRCEPSNDETKALLELVLKNQ